MRLNEILRLLKFTIGVFLKKIDGLFEKKLFFFKIAKGGIIAVDAYQ